LVVYDAVHGTHFPAFDGNGNVTALVRTDGTLAAQYEFRPFGEILRATGPMAMANPFRFSTKYQDDETGLLYYGFRYYDSSTGRWPNRDPLQEKGGGNLYGFINNNAIGNFDPDGREIGSICPKCGQYYVGDHVCTAVPRPGASGDNARRLGGFSYFSTSCCKSKKDRLSPIPGVSTQPAPPTRSVGPGTGTYEVISFPTTPPSAVGGGGAGPCHLLVVKCPDFAAVFHFTVGDSPSGTLGRFTWPSGCSAIMCGGDDSGQSNCLGDEVKSAAKTAGFALMGVSGNSGCGLGVDGSWWQYGN
jgi:RHS repeat-associated protein